MARKGGEKAKGKSSAQVDVGHNRIKYDARICRSAIVELLA
jgi:hypothetical protein